MPRILSGPACLVFSVSLLLFFGVGSGVARAASFSSAAPMMTARVGNSSTLLPNGMVLVAGGNNSILLSSTELYDPSANAWIAGGNLTTARQGQTATLLLNGQVLVAGGTDNNGAINNADLYDPASNTWIPVGTLSTPRQNHTATLLPNGQVLVVGGSGPAQVSSAELYDPPSKLWLPAASLTNARAAHTATLLPNGKVLVAGGFNNGVGLVSAEVYDPTGDSWTSVGSLANDRFSHTATLLPNGKVLAAAGQNDAGMDLTSAELFDPATNMWSAAASLAAGRVNHTASLLPNGQVLVTGGGSGGGSFVSTAEVYDPVGNGWSSPGDSLPRYLQTATLLPNGRVLLAGGYNGSAISAAELFDSTSGGSWSTTGSMAAVRVGHSATLLPGGQVLAAGGTGSGGALTSAELFDPGTNMWSPAGSLTGARYFHTATLLNNGQVLVAGGTDNSGDLASAELYDPVSNTFSPAASMVNERYGHTATLLPNGQVLVAGGYNLSANYLDGCELYDPGSDTWSPAGSLNTARYFHTATLLIGGQVLVTGGFGGSSLTSSELYDPDSDTWSPVGNLNTGRYYFAATLLPNGQVLVEGGDTAPNSELTSAELYDPVAQTWSAAGSLTTGRFSHAATLLPSGKVLVEGGQTDAPTYFTSSEIYDPTSNTWSAAGNLNTARSFHTATLLPNGNVLVAGGSNGANLNSAELYDPGLGVPAGTAPVIDMANSPLTLGTALVLTGSGFQGISESSGGSTNNSSSNYPVVQIQSLVNQQSIFILPDPTLDVSDTDFSSIPVVGFPLGFAAVTVFTNGVPSNQAIVNIVPPLPMITLLTSDNPGFPNTDAGIVFSASDSGTSTLMYTLDFGDGQTTNGTFMEGTNVPVPHTYAMPGNFTVMLTVTDGMNPVTQSFVENIPAPDSGGTGTNVDTGTPIVNPLDGIGIQVMNSDAGIIQLAIDVNSITRSAYGVSTDFGDIQGRSTPVSGVNPVHLYTTHNIYVAKTTATNIATNAVAGIARKMLVISTKETGESTPPPSAQGKAGVQRNLVPPTNQGIILKTMSGKFTFSGATKDMVAFSGQIQLPGGLNIAAAHEFIIGMGNVVCTTEVNTHGKGTAPGSPAILKTLAIKYPKIKKGALTAGGEIATISVTFNTPGLIAAGFDTEGIAKSANGGPIAGKSSSIKIQIGMLLDGVSYQSLAPVVFTVAKNNDFGSISGRK